MLAPTAPPEAPAASSEPLGVVMLGSYNSPHIGHLTRALQERGHRVTLAGYEAPGQPPSVLSEMAVHDTPPVFGRRGFIEAARWLRELVRGEGAEVVHAHYVSRYTYLGVLARAAPTVVTAWGSDVLLEKPERNDRFFDWASLRFADALTGDSQTLVDRMIERGARRRRTNLIRWGVDLERFGPGDRLEAREHLGLGPGPVILSPRAAKPLYNIDLIVEAFERLADDDPALQLVVKYYGSDPPDLAGAHHADRIRVVGMVSDEEMTLLMQAAEVLVSIPDSDSSPRTIWEAMACGVPCVVSDLPWVEELVEPGRDALVVPISADVLTEALRRLLGDPGLRESIAARGKELVAEHHDVRRETAKLEAIYRDLI